MALSSFSGARYRQKYQELSMKVSSVSVSRFAGPSQVGQVVEERGCPGQGVATLGSIGEVIRQQHR